MNPNYSQIPYTAIAAAGSARKNQSLRAMSTFTKTIGVIAMASLLSVGSSSAATKTWIASPALNSGNWNTSTNWSAAGAPVSGDLVAFSTSTQTALTNNILSLSLTGFLFNSGASAFTIGGNDITLTGGITNNSTSAQIINNNLSNNSSITINSTTTGNITLGGNLSGTGTITQNSSSGLAVTLFINGTNSGFNGSFIQNNASGNAGNRTSFGNANAGSANAAWQFDRAVNGGVVFAFGNGTISFGSLSGGAYLRNNNASTTTTVRVGDLNTSTSFSGQLQQNNTAAISLLKAGTGTFTLTGTGNNYAGPTIITNGAIVVAAGGSIGSGSLSINSGSSLIMSNTNLGGQTFSGGLTGAGTITQGSTNLTIFTGTNASTATFNVQAGAIEFQNTNAWGSAAYTSSNGVVLSNGGAVIFGVTNFGTANLGTLYSTFTAGTGTAVFGYDTTGTNFTNASNIIDGTAKVGIASAGSGTLNLTGNNSFTGGVWLYGGTLGLTNVTGNGIGANTITVANSSSILARSDLNLANNITFRNASALTYNNGGFNVTNSGNFTGSGNLSLSGSGTTTLSGSNTVAVGIGNGVTLALVANAANTSAGVAYVTGQIGGPGTGTSGYRFLSDSNVTFNGFDNAGGWADGVFNFFAGNVTAGNSNRVISFLTNGTMWQNMTNNFEGTNGYSFALGTLTQVGANSTLFSAGSASVTIRSLVANNNYTAILGGTNTGYNAITNGITTGSGKTTTLSKTGSGTWYVLGASTGLGNTTISAGTLVLGGTLNGGTYGGTIANSGALVMTNSAAQTLSGVISGTGSFAQSGTGTTTLSVANSHTGGTTVNAGQLTAGINNAFGTRNLTVTGGTASLGAFTGSFQTLTQSGGTITGSAITATNYTISGGTYSQAFAGSGATFNKVGSSTYTLGNVNTYTGLTTVNGGTLKVSLTNGIAASSGVTIASGGTLQFDTASSTLTLGGLTMSGNAILALTQTSASVTTAGNVSISGTGGTNVISLAGTWSTLGTYNLVNFGTLSLGDPNNLALIYGGNGTATLGNSFTYNNKSYSLGSNSSSIYLTISSLSSSLFWSATPANNNWNTTDANWSAQTNGGGTPQAFAAGNDVTFGESATNGAITAASPISAGIIAVTNTAGSVVLKGAGSISGTTFTKSGNGNLVVSNSLILSDAVIIGGTNNTTFAGAVSALSLTMNGAGSLTLGSSNAFSNASTITAGTIFLGNDGALGTNAVTIGGGASLQGAGTNVTLNNAVTIGSGGAGFAGSNNITLAAGLSGSSSLSKTGSGTLALNAAGSYSGATTINGGAIRLNNNSALGSGVALTINSASGLLFGSGVNSLTFGSLAGNGSFNLTNSDNGAVALSVGGNNASTTFSGSIRGTGAFTKDGTGTQTLSGSNSYSGGTTINAGAIVVGNAFALGSSNGIAVNTGATLDLGGYNEAFSALSGSGTITSSIGGATLSLSNNDALTVANTLSGGLALVKSGSGTATISLSNSYTGGTTINGGQVFLSVNNALGSGTITINNAWLNLANNLTLTNDLSIIGSSSLSAASAGAANINANLSGSGTLIYFNNGYAGGMALGGSNGAFTGTFIQSGLNRVPNNNGSPMTFTSVNAGSANANWSFNDIGDRNRLNLNFGSGTISFGSLSGGAQMNNLASGTTTIRVGDVTNNTTYSGFFRQANSSSVISLLKVGTGTLTLTANQNYNNYNNASYIDYAGGTTINAGALVAGSATAFGTGTLTIAGGTANLGGFTLTNTLATVTGGALTNGTISNNGGTFTFNSSSNVAISAVLAGSNGLTQSGSGTTTLSGNNTYSGGSTMSGGTLAVSSTGLGSGSLTMNGGGLIDNGTTTSITNAINVASNSQIRVSAAGGSLTLNGNISGNGNIGYISDQYAGNLYLGGNNSGYNGTFTQNYGVNGTALTFTSANAGSAGASWVLNDNNDNNRVNLSFGSGTISFGALSGPAQINATATGVGTTTLRVGDLNTSTSYSGYFRQANSNNLLALLKVGSGTLTLNANATYNNNYGGQIPFAGGTTINGGTLLAGANNAFGSGSITVNGSGTLALGGYNASNSAIVLNGGSIIGSGTLSANTYSASGGAVGASLAGGSFTKTSAGTLSISSINTYSGGTTVSGGSISFTKGGAFGSGNVSLADTTSLNYTGVGSATLSNNISVSSGAGLIQNTSGSLLTLSGSLTKEGSVLALAGGSFNVTGSILGDSGSYNSDLLISNAAVTLSGNNSFYGPVSILGGSTLTAGVANALPTTTVLTIGGAGESASVNNSFDLNGNNQTLVSITDAGSGLNRILNNGNNARLSLTGNSTFGGQVNGNLNLNLSGAGTTTLSGNNGYTGTTTVNGGKLNLGSTGSLSGTTAVTVTNGGTLLLGANNQVNTSASLSLDNGTLSMGGNGSTRAGTQTFSTLTLTGNSVIDFANLTGTSSITFSSIVGLGTYTLSINNWSGINQYGQTSSGDATFLYDLTSLSSAELNNIRFFGTDGSFLGQGAFSGNQIVPVPEPGVIVSAFMLLGLILWSNRGSLAALARRRA